MAQDLPHIGQAWARPACVAAFVNSHCEDFVTYFTADAASPRRLASRARVPQSHGKTQSGAVPSSSDLANMSAGSFARSIESARKLETLMTRSASSGSNGVRLIPSWSSCPSSCSFADTRQTSPSSTRPGAPLGGRLMLYNQRGPAGLEHSASPPGTAREVARRYHTHYKQWPEPSRHDDAAAVPTGCRITAANALTSPFPFSLNQDNRDYL